MKSVLPIILCLMHAVFSVSISRILKADRMYKVIVVENLRCDRDVPIP